MIGDHAVEHHCRPRLRRFEMMQWIQLGWRLDQAGQHRRLRQRQIGGARIKEKPRRRRHPVGAVAEIDAVQVAGQDLVLGEMRLQPDC